MDNFYNLDAFTKVLYPPEINLNQMIEIVLGKLSTSNIYQDQRSNGKLGRVPLVNTLNKNELSGEGQKIRELLLNDNWDGILEILTSLCFLPHLHFFSFILWKEGFITVNNSNYLVGNKKLMDIILDMIKFKFPKATVTKGNNRYIYEKYIISLAKDKRLNLIIQSDNKAIFFNREKTEIIKKNFRSFEYTELYDRILGR